MYATQPIANFMIGSFIRAAQSFENSAASSSSRYTSRQYTNALVKAELVLAWAPIPFNM